MTNIAGQKTVFTDDDGTTISVTISQDSVRLTTNHRMDTSVYLSGRDAFELAQTLIALSGELVDDTAAYEGTHRRG